MNEPAKDLWCEECKCYPDEVNDVYDWAIEKKKWVNDCYELQDVDYGDSHSECPKCNSVLVYKPQGEQDAKPLPKMSGEVSKGEDIPPSETG
jgi:hypothetical protein